MGLKDSSLLSSHIPSRRSVDLGVTSLLNLLIDTSQPLPLYGHRIPLPWVFFTFPFRDFLPQAAIQTVSQLWREQLRAGCFLRPSFERHRSSSWVSSGPSLTLHD